MGLFRRTYTAPGAPPGAVADFTLGLPPRMFLVSYDPEHLEERPRDSVVDLPGLDQIHDPARVDWVDVRGLGDGTVVGELGELLGLHPLALSDVVNVGQRPKSEAYEEHLFIVLRMLSLGTEGEFKRVQVSLFLGDNYVLSFQETHEDCLEPLRERIRAGRKQIRTAGAGYLACMIIDAIVDGYFPLLERYGERLERLEARVLDGATSDILSELYPTKRDLASFRRATWPLREALTSMIRDEGERLTPTAVLYLRDTLDHTMQVVDVSESYRELSTSLVDVHLSMVGQRTNEIMRVLTVVSAIFISLSFIAGVYGMNFDSSSPWNLPELAWSHGYVYFWALCLGLAGGLLLLFRRLGWLR